MAGDGAAAAHMDPPADLFPAAGYHALSRCANPPKGRSIPGPLASAIISRHHPFGPPEPRHEFIVHAFAPLDGGPSGLAYQQIRRLWEAVGGDLCAGEPTARHDPPHDLPADPGALPPGPVIAAQQRADGRVRAVLRREQDVLNLSIEWLADGEASGRTWREGYEQWAAIAAGDTDELLGIALLYVGFATDHGPLWNDAAVVGGCFLWEVPPYDDHARAARRILVLSTPDRECATSALTSRDEGEMAPLPRYLLGAAKVRHQLRARRSAEAAVRAAADGRYAGADLAALLARLADMRLAVQVARSGLEAARRTLDPSAETAVGLFANDLECAVWAESLLAEDLRYLSSAQRRARFLGTGREPRQPVIGLVTALPEEFAAMASLIDDEKPWSVAGDPAGYVCGTIPSALPGRPHAVVLTLLTETGTNWAATAVANMLRSFESVDQVLMVGIAAGVPAPGDPHRHVRLGDVVVATWGIVDYDHVVDRPGRVTLRQGFPQPSALLAQRVKGLAAGELQGRRPWEDDLTVLLERLPAFARPDPTTDRLYAPDTTSARLLRHPNLAASGHRAGVPKVHEGRIGSANRSLRNAARRDELAREFDLRAIEMEGSGIGSSAFAGGRDWLVVRGISDYGDQRLGHLWRPYASAVAAAYTRALLRRCPPITPHGGRVGG